MALSITARHDARVEYLTSLDEQPPAFHASGLSGGRWPATGFLGGRASRSASDLRPWRSHV